MAHTDIKLHLSSAEVLLALSKIHHIRQKAVKVIPR